MTDRATGITSVVRLGGLLAVQRWIDALDRFDQNGDYGVFAPLLKADGVPADKARCLEEATFYEQTFNLADAARKIGTFLTSLDAGLTGTSRLFRDSLARQMEWARSGSISEHQSRLASVYLSRRDFVRAAVLAWESLISRECETHGLDRNDFSDGGGRDLAEQALRERMGADGQQGLALIVHVFGLRAEGLSFSVGCRIRICDLGVGYGKLVVSIAQAAR